MKTSRLEDLALSIQRIAAPTFAEQRRAAFILDCFRAEGLADAQIDTLGNVLARLPGQGSARPVVLSAHLDTVFPEGADLSAARDPQTLSAPGIGDNALGVAGLLAVCWALKDVNRHPLPGDLWLVANVGEEGLGDLCGMKAVVDRFGSQPLAYVVLEGMAFGQVYHRGLGVKRYRVAVETDGGHSWVDYGAPSAIHELAQVVTRLTEIALPLKPRTTLNVGRIAGGTSVNTIAAQAWLELDLRSEAVDTLVHLADQVEALVEQSNFAGVTCTIETIGWRPAGEISPDHPLVQMAVRSLEEQGVTARLSIGSTDANIPLSRGLPAVCVGLTTGSGAHTTHELIQLAPIARGMAQVVSLIQKIFVTNQPPNPPPAQRGRGETAEN